MKKLIYLLMSLLIMSTASFAQNSAPGKTKAPTAKTAAPDAAKTGKTKKDGTPDKRYKENKAAKPASGPVKKDGTPDMRYKANKDAAKTKEATKKK